uniref:Uncharacterized protein n=1 Tax=Aegilops tauschii subsp. strangulata TaxID=200361 RepID=A0A453LIX0_AEGTS
MHRSHGLVPCQLFSMTSTVHRQDVLPLAYKFSKQLSSTPSLLHPLIHQLSTATSIAHFFRSPECWPNKIKTAAIQYRPGATVSCTQMMG